MTALDTVIRKLEKELEERKSAYEAILSNAADNDREPNDSEKETMAELTNRMAKLNEQLEGYDATEKVIGQFTTRAKELDQAITTRRSAPEGGVEYRSAGEYIVDLVKGATGSKEAQERLEVYTRVAAHQKTSDNLGVIPDPIVGGVVNFIDAARPLTTALGVMGMDAATWYRPVITQQPAVAVQGSAGAAADEKAELTSQKMTLSRITGEAVTYGGYVNVSRQNIDFSSPQIMQIVVDGLARQYAISTETALGTEIAATTTTAVGYGTAGNETAATIRGAIWSAAGDIYGAVPGSGSLILALSPGALETFGPLFEPIALSVGTGEGLQAGDYRSGAVGAISGVPAFMSSGLPTGEAFLIARDAIEVFEQRVGTLQVTEPSVLGVQVAYAGYFTPLTIDDDGIVPLTAT